MCPNTQAIFYEKSRSWTCREHGCLAQHLFSPSTESPESSARLFPGLASSAVT